MTHRDWSVGPLVPWKVSSRRFKFVFLALVATAALFPPVEWGTESMRTAIRTAHPSAEPPSRHALLLGPREMSVYRYWGWDSTAQQSIQRGFTLERHIVVTELLLECLLAAIVAVVVAGAPFPRKRRTETSANLPMKVSRDLSWPMVGVNALGMLALAYQTDPFRRLEDPYDWSFGFVRTATPLFIAAVLTGAFYFFRRRKDAPLLKRSFVMAAWMFLGLIILGEINSSALDPTAGFSPTSSTSPTPGTIRVPLAELQRAAPRRVISSDPNAGVPIPPPNWGVAVAPLTAGNQTQARSATVTQTTATATLQDAIRAGLVAVIFTALGGSSGDAVKVDVRRLRDAGRKRLALRVPAGSILRSASAAVQNMVVMEVRGRLVGDSSYTPESEIVVDNQPVTYILSVMCADFDKDNPPAQATFSLVEPQDPVLACIAREVGGDTPVPAAQAAVWMHTDKASYSEVNDRFPVSPVEWATGEDILRSCVVAR